MCIENVTTAVDAMNVAKWGISLRFGSFFITSQTADYSIFGGSIQRDAACY
eukprot:COSAG01_NODE_6075_length_3863_cov_5.111495_3_plen_51_part_00